MLRPQNECIRAASISALIIIKHPDIDKVDVLLPRAINVLIIACTFIAVIRVCMIHLTLQGK